VLLKILPRGAVFDIDIGISIVCPCPTAVLVVSYAVNTQVKPRAGTKG
jgi:hypothetical protein